MNGLKPSVGWPWWRRQVGPWRYELQVTRAFRVQIPQSWINPPPTIPVEYDREYGLFIICKGYAWDGVTGIPDLPCLMAPAMLHDAMYQLIREGFIPQRDRRMADLIFKREALVRSPRWLALVAYRAVRLFGWAAARGGK